MSDSIMRRNSSKQGLQDLIKVTAQRSLEDAEEIERERRRRARERQRSLGRTSSPSSLPPDTSLTAEDTVLDSDLKPSGQLGLEEDEGFSDWTHKLDKHKQPCGDEQEGRGEQNPKDNMSPKQRQNWCPEDGDEWDKGDTQEASRRCVDEKVIEKKAMKISYTSKVFMPKDMRHSHSNGDTTERTSYLVAGTMSPCRSSSLTDPSEVEVEEAFLKTEERLEEDSEMKLEKEEGRKVEVVGRRLKALSISSTEGDEPMSPFIPMSPTFKNEMEERVTAENTCTINERTESLNRFVQKSNSMKKSQPAVPVSKIDNRLEQYTHAVKVSSDEANTPKQVMMDLPSPTEPVAAKKSLFEVGDAWNQNAVKATPSKDAEGLKVGVADLINQWVKGSPDDSGKNSASKPAEIKPGDVLSKKNLWENLKETSSPGQKVNSSGKRYKFMVTGHGKYEKVPIDDNGNEYTIGQSAERVDEDS